TGVPIGMINSSWGGTPAEIWMPADVIENNEYLLGASKKLRAAPWGPHEPGRAYNTMIAPLRNFKIAGALWYQGEGNAANAMEYKDMFSTLITSWREQWGYEFPFYYVQIAPYKYGEGNRGTLVRDAQRRTLEVPNTGMVVVSDIGNTQNIHPSNKIDIGYRMANLALSNYYKTTDVVSSGPLYKGREIEKAKVRVLFDNAVGLNVKGKEITHFEIAGENKIYYPAKAKIDGSSVVVQAKEVKNPAFVRFAWDNVAEPNLFNSAGLPTSCFTSEN
ncbi:MAG: sialate O-acetylesterase, partial [Bacteroidetes bacterium]|nr:sialate O-acetylesterase [Bacteroidota bacterium]